MSLFFVGGADRKETLIQWIVIRLWGQVKRQFRRAVGKIKDAKLKTRYLIILHTAEGYSHREIAKMLLCSPSTVGWIRRRCVQKGEVGLMDHRGDVQAFLLFAVAEAADR